MPKNLPWHPYCAFCLQAFLFVFEEMALLAVEVYGRPWCWCADLEISVSLPSMPFSDCSKPYHVIAQAAPRTWNNPDTVGSG